MTSETRQEATDNGTLAETFVNRYESDRLALMYTAPTGEATTARQDPYERMDH